MKESRLDKILQKQIIKHGYVAVQKKAHKVMGIVSIVGMLSGACCIYSAVTKPEYSDRPATIRTIDSLDYELHHSYTLESLTQNTLAKKGDIISKISSIKKTGQYKADSTNYSLAYNSYDASRMRSDITTICSMIILTGLTMMLGWHSYYKDIHKRIYYAHNSIDNTKIVPFKNVWSTRRISEE